MEKRQKKRADKTAAIIIAVALAVLMSICVWLLAGGLAGMPVGLGGWLGLAAVLCFIVLCFTLLGAQKPGLLRLRGRKIALLAGQVTALGGSVAVLVLYTVLRAAQ